MPRLGRGVARYLGGSDVLDMAAALDLPPCLLMRRLLEALLRLSKQVCRACRRARAVNAVQRPLCCCTLLAALCSPVRLRLCCRCCCCSA